MSLILGLESSCDDTAAALVTSDRQILASLVAGQNEAHRPFGGVVPEIAARAHVECLDVIIGEAMATAEVGWSDLDGIAATAGPGLVGGLIVGLTTAKAIALARGIPLIAVNHLEAHALTVGLTDGVEPPYLLLLVSGGHTQLQLVLGVGRYERLGTTIVVATHDIGLITSTPGARLMRLEKGTLGDPTGALRNPPAEPVRAG